MLINSIFIIFLTLNEGFFFPFSATLFDFYLLTLTFVDSNQRKLISKFIIWKSIKYDSFIFLIFTVHTQFGFVLINFFSVYDANGKDKRKKNKFIRYIFSDY